MWIFIAHLPDGFLDHGTGGPTRRKRPKTEFFRRPRCDPRHPAAPDPHPHRHPRAGDTLVTLFKDEPALAGQLGFTAGAMQKGRSLH
jgi:hypothetical protein